MSTPRESAAPIRVGVVGIGQRAYIAHHVATSPDAALVVAAADTTAEGAAGPPKSSETTSRSSPRWRR
ncbi:hypothetical protein [Frondihabitans sucicola]|uniref:hypothetical protein n=1 Tax=Frondihabitans sucicola TaxID=1268041 RepID=UPI002572AF88|nr:hypothetical protein [Frondihabitans sucicola]